MKHIRASLPGHSGQSTTPKAQHSAQGHSLKVSKSHSLTPAHRSGRKRLSRKSCMKTAAFLACNLAGGETIACETVVIAAGTWSSAIARSVGLNIPMQPARGYHRDLRGIPATPHVGGVIRGTSIAFTPMFDRLRLAGTLELAGYDQPWISSRLDALSNGAAKVIQGVEEADVVDEWAGYRPCTHDGLPILGAAPELEGLYIATGHAMMGMTLGPYSGVVYC